LVLNKGIITVLKPYYVDLVGFANIAPYESELVKLGGNIVKGYSSAISLGLAIPDSIVDLLPQRADVNVACEYRIQGYDVLNNRLNILASVASSYLNQKGYRTLPISAADRTSEENATPAVSHKMIAHIAGSGWIGKSCLLVTPQYGPRVRLISVLTNAPLECFDNPGDQKCGECNECVKICPVQAIKGKNYVPGEPREVRFDFLKCQNYFEEMKATRKYNVCGLCLYVCPFGKRNALPR
jgi:epoxyqueuosine reductase